MPVQLVLFYVAPMLGFVGRNQAASFERYHHKRPWGTPPSVWGIACVVLGPVAGCALLIAEHTTARRLDTTRAVASPQQPSALPSWSPAPLPVPSAPPLPLRSAPRHLPPRPPQPAPRPQHGLPHPQPHPTDAHRLYLFGIPHAQPAQQCAAPAGRGWSSPQYGGIPAGNVGGTDMLPRRDLPRHPRS